MADKVEDPPVEDPPVEDKLLEDPLSEDPPAEDPPAEDPPAEEPKAKKTIDERLDELNTTTWEMREAERNANAATVRANAATEKLEAAAAKAGDPKPEEDNFDSNAEWVEALTDWKVKQAKLGVPAKPTGDDPPAATPQQEATLRDWDLRRAKAAGKYKGFAENEAMTTRVLKHYNNVDLTNLLMESEVGPEIVNHLGKNPDKLERIAKLSALSAAKEIGRLEDQLSKTVKKTTKSPAPISPAAGGGGTGTKDYANMSDEQFQEERNKAGY